MQELSDNSAAAAKARVMLFKRAGFIAVSQVNAGFARIFFVAVYKDGIGMLCG